MPWRWCGDVVTLFWQFPSVPIQDPILAMLLIRPNQTQSIVIGPDQPIMIGPDQTSKPDWAQSGSLILLMLPILVMTSWDPKIDISPKMLKMPDSDSLWSVPGIELVLWSFKPGTYQTGSFAELTPRQSFKLRHVVTPVSSRPLVLPLMIELCHVVIDEVWLAFLQWRAISLTQRNTSKSSDDFIRGLGITQQELWRFRKSSHDNCWLAMPSPSDLRHKKCHIYH
jgi:hypothetical protein